MMLKITNHCDLPGLEDVGTKSVYTDQSVSTGYWVKSVPIRCKNEAMPLVYKHVLMLGQKACEKPDKGMDGFRRFKALAELLNTKRTTGIDPNHDRHRPASDVEPICLPGMPSASEEAGTNPLQRLMSMTI